MKKSEAEAYFKARIEAAKLGSESGDPHVADKARDDLATCTATLIALGVDQFEPEAEPPASAPAQN